MASNGYDVLLLEAQDRLSSNDLEGLSHLRLLWIKLGNWKGIGVVLFFGNPRWINGVAVIGQTLWLAINRVSDFNLYPTRWLEYKEKSEVRRRTMECMSVPGST
jgi:hypothetical protein